MTGCPANNSPIARALGDDFINLHTAVRKHYSEPTVVLSGVMNSINVKTAIRPVALLSYMLFRAPVPRSGENVEFTVHSRVDGSGVMYWLRTFFGNDGSRRNVTFSSHMAFSGDHRIIETTRWGLGVESDLRVDDVGSLVYEIRKYVLRVPFLGLIIGFPTWVSPFGGGCTTETGESEASFRVNFEMAHPVFGRTIGYSGRCRMSSS